MSPIAEELQFSDCFLYFQIPPDAASSLGSRGKKKLGQVCSESFDATYLVWLMPLTFPPIHWVHSEQASWRAACAGQALLVQSKTGWNFTLYFRSGGTWGSSGV